MEWIQERLSKNEKVIFQNRARRYLFLLPLLLIVASIITWSLPIIGVAILIFGTVKYYSKQYFITNRRIIIKNGFFYIRSKEISIHSIDHIIVYQSLADKIFGSGSVIVFGESIMTSKFKYLNNPHDFRNAVYSQLPLGKDPFTEQSYA